MPPVVVTPPTSEPVSLAELKLAAHIDHATEDTFLTDSIVAARQRYEFDTRRQLMEATFDWFLPGFSPQEFVGTIPDGSTIGFRFHRRFMVRSFEIPLPPLRSIVEVEYFDTAGVLTLVPTTVFAAKTSGEPGKIYNLPNQEWPDLEDDRIEDVVRIRFIAGAALVSDVPEIDRRAILLLAQHWIENREAVIADDRIRTAEVPLSYSSIAENRKIILTA